jgi:phage gpG-like protein
MVFDKHKKQIEAAIPKIVNELVIEARNFFDQSWSNKGFTDKTLQTWDPVTAKDGNVKQRPLVETGRLRRSLRTEVTGNSGKVYTEVEYAQIHNEGGNITGTHNVREHTYRTRSGKRATRKAHTRKVNRTVPKRQFMGESAKLNKLHEDIITSHLSKII